MNTLEQLKDYCREKSKEYPLLKEEIWDFYFLACSEAEDEAASEAHEVELATSDIDDLIKDFNKNYG